MKLTQRCPRCLQNLPEQDYTPSTWGTQGRPCGECNRDRVRKYGAAHPEQSRERQNRWCEEHGAEAESARQRFSKYGLTKEDFESMLARQSYKCLGCQIELTYSAHVDHDHETGRVRGLLCGNCNRTLGMVQDDRARLYQLAAYLELDRSRPIVYLIGSLRNPNVVVVGNAIRDIGFTCIDNWFATGEIADDAWRDYSKACGKTYQEALESREAVHVFNFDRAYLNMCDAVVMLYPSGKSGHLELGYAVGSGKHGYILLEEEHQPERYDVMMQFGLEGLFSSLPDLLQQLQEDYGIKEETNHAIHPPSD